MNYYYWNAIYKIYKRKLKEEFHDDMEGTWTGKGFVSREWPDRYNRIIHIQRYPTLTPRKMISFSAIEGPYFDYVYSECFRVEITKYKRLSGIGYIKVVITTPNDRSVSFGYVSTTELVAKKYFNRWREWTKKRRAARVIYYDYFLPWYYSPHCRGKGFKSLEAALEKGL
jgi:hypothetical protein